ncbi:MAG: cation transporter [Prosthecobacter sp.]
MKHILIFLTSLLIITACFAGDPVTFYYEGEVAGVMCSACSNHVQTALAKIPGVKNVSVLPAKEGGIPRLEITATSAAITREDCVKALGSQAKAYDVRSLKIVKSK